MKIDVQTSFAVGALHRRDSMARPPGSIRDAIIGYLSEIDSEASLAKIREAVISKIGEVPSSSVRSYLNLNVPELFERTGRGQYRLKKKLKLIGAMRAVVAACCRYRPAIWSGRIHSKRTDEAPEWQGRRVAHPAVI